MDSGEVHFKDSGLTANLATSPIVNKEKALEAAKKTVSTLGIDTRLFNLDKPLYEFLKTAGHVHLQETIENEANLIYVSFPREIVGSRVVAPGGDDLLTLGVNNNYQIFSLSYSVLEIEDNQAVYKTLGESSVARKLRKGEGRLDHFVDTEESLTRPTLMIATKGEIVFYNDKHTPFVQPIYEIETLARSPVTDLQAKVYLPALNDNYFKN